MALQIRFIIQKLMNVEIQKEIVNEVMLHGGGVETIMEELSPERVKLQRNVGLVQESIGFIENVMDVNLVSAHALSGEEDEPN